YKFFNTINLNSIQTEKTQETKPTEVKKEEKLSPDTSNASQQETTDNISQIGETEIEKDDPAIVQGKDQVANKNKRETSVVDQELLAEPKEINNKSKEEGLDKEQDDQSEKYPKVSFYSIGANSYTISKDSKELNDQDLLPKGTKALFRDGIEQVYINAIYGDTWLTYKIDDKKIKSYNLKQGRSIFLSGKEVLLLIGNFNSIVFFYNNQFIKSNTKSNVKVFVFPKSKSNEYKIPLFPADSNGRLYTSKEYEAILKE
ncbi:hypothetical protein N9N67_11040, partial [Bacteriovoracaceae bacterium]|nr:hypothetical protein [Bacteriovoracaceae bacterium]